MLTCPIEDDILKIIRKKLGFSNLSPLLPSVFLKKDIRKHSNGLGVRIFWDLLL